MADPEILESVLEYSILSFNLELAAALRRHMDELGYRPANNSRNTFKATWEGLGKSLKEWFVTSCSSTTNRFDNRAEQSLPISFFEQLVYGELQTNLNQAEKGGPTDFHTPRILISQILLKRQFIRLAYNFLFNTPGSDQYF